MSGQDIILTIVLCPVLMVLVLIRSFSYVTTHPSHCVLELEPRDACSARTTAMDKTALSKTRNRPGMVILITRSLPDSMENDRNG